MSYIMDIALVILPKIEPDAPTTGPALLKAYLKKAGFSAKLLDFNIKLYRTLKQDGLEDHYNFNNMVLESRFYDSVLSQKYQWLIESWVNELIELKPRFVGFSLLTEYSQVYAINLSRLLKQKAPDIKIVWGGAGAFYNDNETLVQEKVIDYYILGDGEENICRLLRGETDYDGINDGITRINTSMQLDNLNGDCIPDYSDIDWSLYLPKYDLFKDAVYVTGSRGCVKTCDFCNVKELWPRYRFRSAEHIMKEIRYLVYELGRTNVYFTDSLINGSMKEFRALLNMMYELKKEVPEFRWTSQWIIRSEQQSPEQDYEMMQKSGCYKLDVGLESFSEKIRFQMGKKFTDEAMWFCFDMMRKYKLWGGLLMIVGYPTETDEDHKHTLECMERIISDTYRNYLSFSFSSSLMLWPSDDVYKKYQDVIVYEQGPYKWAYKDNTIMKRYERCKELLIKSKTLYNIYGNIPVDQDKINIQWHIKTLENLLELPDSTQEVRDRVYRGIEIKLVPPEGFKPSSP